jgi:hypothetical protein
LYSINVLVKIPRTLEAGFRVGRMRKALKGELGAPNRHEPFLVGTWEVPTISFEYRH